LATQGIRGRANRRVLQRILDTGAIFFARSDEPWILGGAGVRISFVGQDDGSDHERDLDGQPVASVNADLTSGIDLTQARRLPENLSVAFMGDIKVGPFDVPAETAQRLLHSSNPDGRSNSEVVRPFANGLDVVRRSRDVWIIDFGLELAAREAALFTTELQDLSRYQVVMLWPVTDGQRIARIAGFTSPRDGYKLDWNAFHRELNDLDRQTLPLSELNRARLYFDVRLVPIAAADLRPLCRHLDEAEMDLPASYLGRLSKAHLVSVISERWDPSTYAPMRERESERASEARAWYPTVTGQPTQLGRRIALALRQLGFDAKHEQDVTSPYATVRADVLVQRPGSQQDKVIVELKAFNPENTMPSAIKDAIRTTLKRHATFGGFLGRQ